MVRIKQRLLFSTVLVYSNNWICNTFTQPQEIDILFSDVSDRLYLAISTLR
jgi:hypothetical protein